MSFLRTDPFAAARLRGVRRGFKGRVFYVDTQENVAWMQVDRDKPEEKIERVNGLKTKSNPKESVLLFVKFAGTVMTGSTGALSPSGTTWLSIVLSEEHDIVFAARELKWSTRGAHYCQVTGSLSATITVDATQGTLPPGLFPALSITVRGSEASFSTSTYFKFVSFSDIKRAKRDRDDNSLHNTENSLSQHSQPSQPQATCDDVLCNVVDGECIPYVIKFKGKHTRFATSLRGGDEFVCLDIFIFVTSAITYVTCHEKTCVAKTNVHAKPQYELMLQFLDQANFVPVGMTFSCEGIITPGTIADNSTIVKVEHSELHSAFFGVPVLVTGAKIIAGQLISLEKATVAKL